MAVIKENNTTLDRPNHARLGYLDAIETVSATSEQAQSKALAAKTWQTYERWRPAASPATLTAEFGTQWIDYIGIGAHTLSDADTVTIEVQEGGSWVEITPAAISWALDNEAIMALIEPRQLTGVRVTVEYSGEAPSIAKIAAGLVLVTPRPFYGGHAPAMLNEQTVRRPALSESGEWLGTSVLRQGRQTSMQWQRFTAGWYRANMARMVYQAKTAPVFIAWNPRDFSDCIYAQLEGNPGPSNMGVRDWMEVTMSFIAYSDGSRPAMTPYGKDYEDVYPQATEDPAIIDYALNEQWPQ